MTEPLTHARIGYDSITKRATVTASASLTGFPASAAANELTYSFWSAGPPATWEAALVEAEPCNYFGIAAHTLHTNHVVAVMQAMIDGAWQTLPVLTTTGDLWRFDGDLYGLRGAAPGAKFGSNRRGIGADGVPVRPYFNDGGGDFQGDTESKFGTHALTVEPGVINILPENVRNGGDTDGDLTDFNSVASDAAYSTDRAASGAGSVFVTKLSGATLTTDPVGISQTTAYTFQIKIFTSDVIGQFDVRLYGDVSGLLGEVSFDSLPAGAWSLLHATQTTGGSDTTVYAQVAADAGSYYADELQLETGTTPRTWADATRGQGNLAYQPEIIQQIAGDFTVNYWARMPSAALGQYFMNVRTTGGNANALVISNPADANNLAVVTSGPDASLDTVNHTFTWGGTWHMITVVLRPGVSGEDNKILYVDGKLAESVETTKLPEWAAVGTFEVGHLAGAGLLGSDGESLMDDLLILNRAATAAEIKGWYDSGEAVDPASVGLPSHDDDRPIMTLVEEATSNKFRLSFAGQTTPVVGVIYMGKALEMARPIYGGHTPINLARTTVVRPNVSERGQWLGRSIIRSGSGGSWSWSNLGAGWVRRYLDPFIESARELPFFVVWRPESFPGEVGYCWTMGDLAPVNAGVRDLMTFTLDAEGLGNE